MEVSCAAACVAEAMAARAMALVGYAMTLKSSAASIYASPNAPRRLCSRGPGGHRRRLLSNPGTQ